MRVIFQKNKTVNRYISGETIVVTGLDTNSRIIFRSTEAVREYWRTLHPKTVNTEEEHMSEFDMGLFDMEVNEHNCIIFGDVVKKFIVSVNIDDNKDSEHEAKAI